MAGAIVFGLISSGSPTAEKADLRNGRTFIQDNLWSAGDRQYAVLVAQNGTPYAAVRHRGAEGWRSADLGTLPGNPLAAPTARDPHNVYVIGVDASGGVHVSGNMHNEPLRYVRDPSGRLREWQRGPAPSRDSSVSYPAFVGLGDGSLLFWRRVGVAGAAVEKLDVLRPDAESWTALGAVLDGRPTGESPYLHHVAVDPSSGLLHLLYEWRGTAGVEANTDVEYARSPDGGVTWERSDGSRLDLPIVHGEGDTVIATSASDAGLLNQGGLTVDANGMPHGAVTFSQPSGGLLIKHVWLENGAWQTEDLADTGFSGRPQIAGTADGRVWLLGVRDGVALAIDVTPDTDRLEEQEIGPVPDGWELSLDSQALADRGAVETLVPLGATPNVLSVDLPD